MYIKTERHYQHLDDEQLSQFINQMEFKINAFGLWQSHEDKHITYSSDDFEIIYYIAGGSQTNVGKKAYDCPENSLLLLEPYGLNTSTNRGSDYYAYYYIHFEVQPYHLQRQLVSLLTRHGHVLYEDEFRDFKEMFARLLLEVEHKEMGYTSIITAGLMRVLIEMIRAQYKRNTKDYPITLVDNKHVIIVNDAIRYLKDHLQYSFKQENLAKALGVSSSYLYKAFQDVVGLSPTKYVQRYKIMRAQKLLAQNHRVNDVASLLGYSSAYHFSKVFKDMIGMSPKQYQKEAKVKKSSEKA